MLGKYLTFYFLTLNSVRYIKSGLRSSVIVIIRKLKGMIEDITEKMRAENELKKSQDRLLTFVSALPDIAYIYDEDGYLVNTMIGKNIKMLGGKMLASLLEVIPEEEDGHKTQVEYLDIEFDKPIPESFFSIQNMKRVK